MASVAEEEVDRITRLPAAIIHHISFLPFNDVVKTTALSKQWRLAWTSTPYIDLSLPSAGVVPLINRALRLCTAAKIEKFHLHATASNVRMPAELDRWFGLATARKVEDASLVFGHSCHFVPRILCGCASLVSLRVSNCKFSRDVTIRWPSLKKLWVHDVFLGNHGIAKILRGCPVLESLTLSFLHSTCGVRIDSRSLRELVIKAVCISSLDISAPNLLSLRLWAGFLLVGFRPNGLSSLAEAELNFDKLWSTSVLAS
ncbi:hypothetical protein NL676_007964 [Syzygium grande]|nr:hypothetical protein NL676_007964 [Syzygium grande]